MHAKRAWLHKNGAGGILHLYCMTRVSPILTQKGVATFVSTGWNTAHTIHAGMGCGYFQIDCTGGIIYGKCMFNACTKGCGYISAE